MECEIRVWAIKYNYLSQCNITSNGLLLSDPWNVESVLDDDRKTFTTSCHIHNNVAFIYDMRSGNVDECDVIAAWGQHTRERCFG